MSLQLAAQHLASRGRGPDTQLVHMAPQEVAGLHALAKSHGGALTTNPDTGLPEAGFLSSILPMVIGAGITAATGGAAAPWMIGLGVGGAQTLATGSLQKGLMAGLGAYGGAGLAGGLMGAGAAGLGAAETGLTATGGVMGANPMMAQPMTFGTEAVASQAASPMAAVNQGVLNQIAPGAVTTTGAPALAQTSAGVPHVATATAMPAIPAAPVNPTFSDRLSQMGQGLQNLGSTEGREAFMSKEGVGGMKGLMQYGLAGMAPVMSDMMTPKQQAEREKLKPYEYTYSPGRVADPQAGYTGAYTGERTYFNPVYTRTAAGGGLMDINPIGAMSQQNQSQMQPAYAQGGVSDVAINPYTGSETFAEGGDTTAVKPVEQGPYYTMTGQSGDMYKYLMGQGARPAAPAPVPMAAPAPAAAAPTYAARSDGEYVDDTSGTKSYTFDPVTGAYTTIAPPKVFRPFATTTGIISDGYGGGYGGDSGGTSAGVGVGTGEGGGMGNSGEGGGGPGEGGWARGGIAMLAQGGQSHLGDYSDGGRLLRGPGDGVSDSIPASIGDKRPARLADGEFVVPARIVSELGNGSTEAGARKLYAMMDRVQKARAKTTGKDRVATNTKAEKLLPV